MKITIPHPEEVEQIAQRLGQRIRVARTRRKIRQTDLALRTGLSRSTIQSIERGEPACALGSVLLVLWHLGLSNEIELIADPGLDESGLALALSNEGKRVRVRQVQDNDF